MFMIWHTTDSGSSYSDDGGDEEKCDDNEIQQKKGKPDKTYVL